MAERPPEGPSTCSCRAEGVGFEPTEPGGSTVFETVRFGRSRIPPGGESNGAPIGYASTGRLRAGSFSWASALRMTGGSASDPSRSSVSSAVR